MSIYHNFKLFSNWVDNIFYYSNYSKYYTDWLKEYNHKTVSTHISQKDGSSKIIKNWTYVDIPLEIQELWLQYYNMLDDKEKNIEQNIDNNSYLNSCLSKNIISKDLYDSDYSTEYDDSD